MKKKKLRIARCVLCECYRGGEKKNKPSSARGVAGKLEREKEIEKEKEREREGFGRHENKKTHATTTLRYIVLQDIC